MKVALVASSYLPSTGGLERHVDELARGLNRRGVEVEVLTQDPSLPLPRVSEFDGFVVRRFSTVVGSSHIGVSPSLWEHLRRTATSHDIVHVHSAHAPLALAVVRARPRRFMFTPHAAVAHLLRWRDAHIMQVVMGHATDVICATAAESELLRRRFPRTAGRISVVPHGVDVASIEAARPFEYPGNIVLAVGRLVRHKRIDRAIAAMAALEPAFRLAVVGDGAARQKLLAHAADLRVSSRVKFLGSLPDSEFYRWLRTASAVVALAQADYSGLQVIEALAAGVPVVASDIPAHREAVHCAGGTGVTFVSPTGSPLDIADAIYEATASEVPDTSRVKVLSWDNVVDRTLDIYSSAVDGRPRVAIAKV